jgi:hypothetical protein
MTIAAGPCRRKAAPAAMRPPNSVPPTRWIALCQVAEGYACDHRGDGDPISHLDAQALGQHGEGNAGQGKARRMTQ